MQSVPEMGGFHAGCWTVTVGDAEVMVLSDGTFDLDAGMLSGAPRSEIDGLLSAAHMGDRPLRTSVNVYLIRHAGRLILVDSGCGQYYGPSLGKVPGAIRRAGYTLDQITDVLITHAHDDHAGGLLNGAHRALRHATVYLDAREPTNEMIRL